MSGGGLESTSSVAACKIASNKIIMRGSLALAFGFVLKNGGVSRLYRNSTRTVKLQELLKAVKFQNSKGTGVQVQVYRSHIAKRDTPHVPRLKVPI